MIKSSDFPCYVSIYNQEIVHSPHAEGYGVDEVVWMNDMQEYLNWIIDIDEPFSIADMERDL